MIAVFRTRNFRYLWIGQFVSSFGNVFLEVAALWLLQLVSPAYVAAAGFLITAPNLLAALGGSLVDHFGAKRLMILTDVLRTIGVGGMALLVAFHPAGTPVFLLIALFLDGLGGALFSPAEMSILPQAVPEEQLASANGLWQSAFTGSRTVGYAMGGALIAAVGAVALLGFDAVTFAISAASILLVQVAPHHVDPSGSPPVSLQGLKESFEALRGLGWFIPLLPLIVGANLFGSGAFLMLSYWVGHRLHDSASVYGILLASYTAGSIVGSLLTGSVGKLPSWLVVALADMVQAVFYLAFAFWPASLPEAVLLGLAALANAIANALLFTLMQKKIPNEMRGRAFGLLVTLATIGTPLGPVLTGLTATVLPLWWPWVAASLMVLAIGWRMYTVPALHDEGTPAGVQA